MPNLLRPERPLKICPSCRIPHQRTTEYCKDCHAAFMVTWRAGNKASEVAAEAGQIMKLGEVIPRKERPDKVVDSAPLPESDDSLDRYVTPDQVGKDGDEREVITWVARNISCKEPVKAECPGVAAWGMLLQARLAPSSFWVNIYPRLLPTKSVMDARSQRGEDGAMVLTTLDEIERISKGAMG